MSRYVPKNLAKKMNVVPVRVSRDQLFLAMADPLNFMAIEEAKRTSKKRIVPMIRLVNSIIERAVSVNASDIHFEPTEDNMVIRMRIDGGKAEKLTGTEPIRPSKIGLQRILSK